MSNKADPYYSSTAADNSRIFQRLNALELPCGPDENCSVMYVSLNSRLSWRRWVCQLELEGNKAQLVKRSAIRLEILGEQNVYWPSLRQ